MVPVRIVLALSLLSVASLRLYAQRPPADIPTQPLPQWNSSQPVTTIHATARLVVLDVVVSDGHGHPTSGLSPADFTLAEDGVPQTLINFTEHDASTADQSALETQLPPNTFAVHPPVTGNGAMTVIVLSVGYTVSPFIRNQLKSYLKSSTPTTPISIYRLDWQGMHLVQGFTADRSVLLEAATSKRILLPLGFPGRYLQAVGSPAQRLAKYLAGIPGRINVLWISDGGAPGGEIATEFPDISAFIHNLNGGTDVLRLSRIALYPVDANGVVVPMLDQANFAFPVADMSFPTINFGSNADQQIFSTNPEPRLFSFQISAIFPNHDAMFAHADLSDLAASTGGNAFFNTNGFKDVIATVVATGSHYYTLSYRPTNPDWNGDYRRIKVDVAGVPETKSTQSSFSKFLGWSDVAQPKVMYRPGYYARTSPPTPPATLDTASDSPPDPRRKLISVSPKGMPFGATTGPSKNRQVKLSSLESAMSFGTLTPNQVQFTVVVSPSPRIDIAKAGSPLPSLNYLTAPWQNSQYRNYRVHFWIDPQDLKFSRTAHGRYHDNLQLITILYRDDGVIANSIASTVPIEIAADDLDSVMVSGLTFDQKIAVPTTGNFFLRAGVGETSTSHVGALEIPVEWIKPMATSQPQH